MPLKKGSIVKISAGVKHWHGASENSWFTHIALEDWSKGQPEWLEPVAQEDYEKLEMCAERKITYAGQKWLQVDWFCPAFFQF